MEHYFSLLGIPLRYEVDSSELRKRYFEAQRAYHPDKASNDVEKLAFIQRSADINDAYNTLRDDNERLYYLLSLKDVDVKAAQASPDMLFELMERREQAESGEAWEATLTAIANDIETCRNQAVAHLEQDNVQASVASALKLRYLVSMLADLEQRRGM